MHRRAGGHVVVTLAPKPPGTGIDAVREDARRYRLLVGVFIGRRTHETQTVPDGTYTLQLDAVIPVDSAHPSKADVDRAIDNWETPF